MGAVAVPRERSALPRHVTKAQRRGDERPPVVLDSKPEVARDIQALVDGEYVASLGIGVESVLKRRGVDRAVMRWDENDDAGAVKHLRPQLVTTFRT